MKEKLSALLDGDLERQAGRPVLDGLQKDVGLRKDWDAYHLIGDVLRGARLVYGGAAAEARGILATKGEVRELRERVGTEREQVIALAARASALVEAISESKTCSAVSGFTYIRVNSGAAPSSGASATLPSTGRLES